MPFSSSKLRTSVSKKSEDMDYVDEAEKRDAENEDIDNEEGQAIIPGPKDIVPIKTTAIAVSLTVPEDVKYEDDLRTVQEIDLKVMNDQLRMMYFGFGQARSISSLCKLTDTTLKIIEARRNVLGMEYGVKSKDIRTGVWTPIS